MSFRYLLQIKSYVESYRERNKRRKKEEASNPKKTPREPKWTKKIKKRGKETAHMYKYNTTDDIYIIIYYEDMVVHDFMCSYIFVVVRNLADHEGDDEINWLSIWDSSKEDQFSIQQMIANSRSKLVKFVIACFLPISSLWSDHTHLEDFFFSLWDTKHIIISSRRKKIKIKNLCQKSVLRSYQDEESTLRYWESTMTSAMEWLK